MSQYIVMADNSSVPDTVYNAVEGAYEVRANELSLSDPRGWEDSGLFGPRHAGVSVTHRNSLRYPPILQAVNLISGDVAKVPMAVFERTDDGKRKATEHPAHSIVRRKPNPSEHAFKFWRRVMVHLLLYNQAFCWIERDRFGDPVEIYRLLPDRTQLRTDGGVAYYSSEINGELVTFLPSQILHFEGIAIEGDDIDTVMTARESIATGLAAQGFRAKYFENGAQMSGILELPLGMPEKAQSRIVDGFSKKYAGVENAFKVALLRDGVKFHQASHSPRDSQGSETWEQQKMDIASIWNIPPNKLGLTTGVGYNGLEHESASYVDGCLSHWLCTRDAECDLKLLRSSEQDNDTHFVSHNPRALIRSDIKTTYEIGVMGANSGLHTVNEWRDSQDMNKIEGGDAPRRPANVLIEGEESDSQGGVGSDASLVNENDHTAVGTQTNAVTDAIVRCANERFGKGVKDLANAVKKESRRNTPTKMRTWWETKGFNCIAKIFDADIGPTIRAASMACSLEPDSIQETISQMMSARFSTVIIEALKDGTTQELFEASIADQTAIAVRDTIQTFSNEVMIWDISNEA